jgi:hypothetical protein
MIRENSESIVTGYGLEDPASTSRRARHFTLRHHGQTMNGGSSVSIVSDYGLNDRGSIPERGRGFLF